MIKEDGKMDVSVFGHVNVDEYFRVPKIPRFGSINILDRTTFLGGTAANIAKISAMLNMNVELFSVVSKNFPGEYIEYLKETGVNIENLVIDKNIAHGPSCYIVSDGNAQIAYIDQGPMESMQNLEIKKLPSGKWIHFATGNPEFYINLIKKYSIERSRIVFDPGQELTYRYTAKNFSMLLKHSELTILNEKEFEFAKKMVGVKPLKNARNLIITRGSEGCTYYTESIDIKQENIVTGDTTGSGDAFRAGLYLGLKKRYNIVDSCKIANRVAAIVIKHGIYKIDSNALLSEL